MSVSKLHHNFWIRRQKVFKPVYAAFKLIQPDCTRETRLKALDPLVLVKDLFLLTCKQRYIDCLWTFWALTCPYSDTCVPFNKSPSGTPTHCLIYQMYFKCIWPSCCNGFQEQSHRNRLLKKVQTTLHEQRNIWNPHSSPPAVPWKPPHQEFSSAASELIVQMSFLKWFDGCFIPPLQCSVCFWLVCQHNSPVSTCSWLTHAQLESLNVIALIFLCFVF